MKKKLLFLVLIALKSYSQAPVIEWQKTFGGSNMEFTGRMKQTSDGGYVFSAASKSTDIDINNNHGNFDFWVVKTDAFGEVAWQKSYGGSASEIAHDIVQTSDNGYVVVGNTSSNDGDVSGLHGVNSDCWILKVNSIGTIEWKKTLGGTGYEEGMSIVKSTDGGFVIASTSSEVSGDVTNAHGSAFDFWIIKVNAFGTVEWKKNFGGTSNETPWKIIATSDNGYLIVGESYSTNGDVTGHHGTTDWPDIWMVKIDNVGTLQWQKSLGGTGYDRAFCVQQTQDGGYIMGGDADSSDGDVTGINESGDLWLVKTDPLGNIEWQKTYGGSGYDFCYDVLQMPDSGYVLTSYTGSQDGDVVGSHGDCDFWVIRTDASGDLLWQNPFGGSDCDGGYSIFATIDGGFLASGFSASSDGDLTGNYGLRDVWMLKLSAEQLAVNVSKADAFSIYPNPASTVLKLKFQDTISVDTFTIIDSTGKNILQQNYNGNPINVEKLAPGIYIIQAFAKDKTYQTKFIKQ